MALELRQQLKLSQQLVMTPQLQQAIKLLQLSRVELLETVQQELLENPFLEEAPANEPVAPQDQEEPRHEKPQDEVYDEDLSRNADWEEYLGEFASTPRTSQGRELEIAEEISPLEARYSAKPTLEGHLLWQLHLSTLTDEQKEIGEIIIGNLGSSGYLRASVEEIAEMASTTPEAVQTVLERVQLFDPVGVAARDARECLLVQLKSLRYDRDPILLELVQSHLEDLEAHRYKPLLRKFKLDMEGLREYLDIIQSLEPLPGASFDGSEPTYVSPDVFVYSVGDEFVILLNEDGLPHLQLSSMLRDGVPSCNEKEKDYVSEKVRSASWLIRSLYQRQRTLYNVATPHGIFELKFFFNSGLELDDGSQVGSESVKALIKKFIAGEDPKSPLSDERLGELLKEQLKVNIARRTVAKYRTALNIPSSSKRKEHF